MTATGRKISSMRIRLTGPMQNAITPELMQRIERTVDEFPELEPHILTVGLVVKSNVQGNADAGNMVIRLNTRHRSGMTYFTNRPRGHTLVTEARLRNRPKRRNPVRHICSRPQFVIYGRYADLPPRPSVLQKNVAAPRIRRARSVHRGH
jgi:hypothetical protein